MIEKFKSMPTDLKLSIAFLFVTFAAIAYLIPLVCLGLIFWLGLAFSTVRIISYITNGE